MPIMSSCGCARCAGMEVVPNSRAKPVPGQPDPTWFTILLLMEIGNVTIAEVRYPDATNFEGKKILVFSEPCAARLRTVCRLDPHFCEHDRSLIARFRPDADGMRLAIRLARVLTMEE